MKIVILDADPAFGSASAPATCRETISTAGLEELGELVVWQKTEPEQVVERARGADVVVTNKVLLGELEFRNLPELKLVSILATGYNIIDLDAARTFGVTICNVPGYSTAATAQHAIALLLELTQSVGAHSVSAKSGAWQNADAFSYYLSPLVELEGKTLGIIGLGSIGRRVQRVAEALGMRVLAHSRSRKHDDTEYVVLDQLLAESDAVSLHAPLTAETHGIINAANLAKMKDGALLVNVARGPLLVEDDVADSLESGKLGGVAVDVLSVEPPREGSRLLEHPNALVTPHIAWAASAARARLVEETCENVRAFTAGKPRNVVGR